MAAALSAQPFDGSEIFDGRSGEEGQIGLAAARRERGGIRPSIGRDERVLSSFY